MVVLIGDNLMASAKQPVLVERPLHSQLKTRLRNKDIDMTTVVSRLIEMYLNGEVKITLPERSV